MGDFLYSSEDLRPSVCLVGEILPFYYLEAGCAWVLGYSILGCEAVLASVDCLAAATVFDDDFWESFIVAYLRISFVYLCIAISLGDRIYLGLTESFSWLVKALAAALALSGFLTPLSFISVMMLITVSVVFFPGVFTPVGELGSLDTMLGLIEIWFGLAVLLFWILGLPLPTASSLSSSRMIGCPLIY